MNKRNKLSKQFIFKERPPFGIISEVNITPYIKPGKLNRIELWPATMATFNEDQMEVKAIKIGCKMEVKK
ncbi:hypothetical protein H5T87_09860 [bacterium]|nr:hypothetical protein [bacterium]